MSLPVQASRLVRRSWSWITLEHLWPIAVLAGIALLVNTNPIKQHDFWWHLKAGQDIIRAGRIPAVETFSYTMNGTSYHYATYWLMEVIFYLVFSIGGLALIVFVQSLMVTGAYSLLLRLCWRIGNSWRVAAASTLFAAMLGFTDWNVRPQVIAFPTAAVVLTAIYEYRLRPRRWLLALPPTMLCVWANSHGSFVIGLAMLGVWLADDLISVVQDHLGNHAEWRIARAWPSASSLAISSVACLANPRGIGVFWHATDLASNPYIRNMVPEWAPPSFADVSGALFLGGLLMCAIALAKSPRRPSWFQLLTFAGSGALALSTSRGVVWFGIAMAPVMADHLHAIVKTHTSADLNPRGSGGRPALNFVFVSVLLVGVLLSLPWFKHVLPLPSANYGLVSVDTPVAATEFLIHERPNGRLFHELGAGSYLIWAAQPDYPVFVDTRLELYPLEIWRDYLAISGAEEGWQERLDRYRINTLMLDPTKQARLIAAVRKMPSWRLAYQDEAAVILVR